MAVEQAMVWAIAHAEHSVVAIARVRKERAGEALNLEFRPDPFGRRPSVGCRPGPDRSRISSPTNTAPAW